MKEREREQERLSKYMQSKKFKYKISFKKWGSRVLLVLKLANHTLSVNK